MRGVRCTTETDGRLSQSQVIGRRHVSQEGSRTSNVFHVDLSHNGGILHCETAFAIRISAVAVHTD